MLNPFLLRELDKQLLLAYLRALFEDELRRRGEQADGATTLRFDFFMESYLRSDASARVKAVLAVSERRLPEALELYRKALAQDRDEAAAIHAERARVIYLIGNDDSTRAEIALALDKLRERDVKHFVYLYESKALLEHSIGLSYEAKWGEEGFYRIAALLDPAVAAAAKQFERAATILSRAKEPE